MRSGTLGTKSNPSGYEAVEKEDLGDTKALKRIKDKRHLTDVTCCLLFLFFCVGMGFIVQRSLKKGDPRRLYHGFDYKGNLCGVDQDVVDKPLMYWPNPQKMRYPVCMEHCPQSDKETVLIPKEKVDKVDTVGHHRLITITQEEVEVKTYASHKLGGRFCLPAPDHTHHGLFRNFTSKMANSSTAMSMISARVQDISNGWGLLLLALPLAILLGYLYMFFLKHCVWILVWSMILLSILSSVGLGYYCLAGVGDNHKAAEQLLGKYVEDPAYTVKVIGYSACGVAGLLILMLLCLYHTITAIIGVVEASCDAIWAMPFLLPLPIFDVLIKIIFTLLWMICFCWVITSGKVGSPEAYVDTTEIHGLVRKFDFSFVDKCCIVYFVIGLVWIFEMITAVTHFVISFSVAIWYFTPCLRTPLYGKRNMDASLFGTGIAAALRYHMGSLALGALIVAMFRLCYGILAVVARTARAQHNPLAECIAKTFMCCVWCFEEIVCYVNKNAIIEMVLKSTDFFTSAGSAVAKLINAAPQVAGLNGITVLFQVLGTILITGACAVVTFLLAKNVNVYSLKDSEYFLEEPLVVVVCATLIGFVVACAYMVIFDMVSDTLLFCWLTDTEDGVTEFAPAPLRNIVGHPERKKTTQGNSDF